MKESQSLRKSGRFFLGNGGPLTIMKLPLCLNPFVSQVGFFLGEISEGSDPSKSRLNPFVSQVGFFLKNSLLVL